MLVSTVEISREFPNVFFFALEVVVHYSCIGDRFQGNVESIHIADKVSRNAILPRRFLHDVMVNVTFTF
jgi:hypothetical protein